MVLKGRSLLGLGLFFFFLGFQLHNTALAEASWRLEINIPALAMTVYSNEIEWGRFPVAVGKIATPTPEGRFTIVNKVINPTWSPPNRPPVPPGPNNPLGRYWLGLSLKSYGIHGNNRPSSIGHPVSNGCIRMRNEDIKRLYTVLPVGTPVQIIYRLVESERAPNNKLYISVYPDVYRRVKDPWHEIRTHLITEFPDGTIHEEGLRWVWGGKSLRRVEIPRTVPVKVDGERYSHNGFVWYDQLYLPHALRGYFGGRTDASPPFLPYEELNAIYPGGFILDQNEDELNLKTIRVMINGQEFSTRALYIDEPLLELEHVLSLLGADNPTIAAGLDGSLTAMEYEGRRWIRLSKISLLSGRISVEWDPGRSLVQLFL